MCAIYLVVFHRILLFTGQSNYRTRPHLSHVAFPWTGVRDVDELPLPPQTENKSVQQQCYLQTCYLVRSLKNIFVCFIR